VAQETSHSIAQWLLCVHFFILQVFTLSLQTVFMGFMWSCISIINQMVPAVERQQGTVIISSGVLCYVCSPKYSDNKQHKTKELHFCIYVKLLCCRIFVMKFGE
jgi:hypothetical protein